MKGRNSLPAVEPLVVLDVAAAAAGLVDAPVDELGRVPRAVALPSPWRSSMRLRWNLKGLTWVSD